MNVIHLWGRGEIQVHISDTHTHTHTQLSKSDPLNVWRQAENRELNNEDLLSAVSFLVNDCQRKFIMSFSFCFCIQ